MKADWRKNKQLLLYLLMFITVGSCATGLFVFVLQYPVRKNHLPRKFGATYMTMDNQYFEILNTAIEDIVESNGDQLITRDPAQNQQKQNNQIMDMLAMGVDLIFINPVDWKSITPALQKCHDRSVPFIVVDTDVYHDELAASVILSDNYGAGVLIGRDLIEKRHTAKIVILYDRGINSTDLRTRGFLDTIRKSPLKYRIVYTVNGTSILQQSMIEMQKFLETGLDFDIVFGGNDPTALGALAAIQKNHLDRTILLYGIDGSPSAKMMIQQGYMEGTTAQFPQVMGKKAAELAYDYLSGKHVNHKIFIPVQLITRKNLDAFDVLGWQ